MNKNVRERLDNLSRFDKNTGCRVWIGSKHYKGYGQIKINGKVEKAHRAAWVDAYGPIPEGKMICHDCPDGNDNPSCIELSHLWLGDALLNAQDREAKGRGNQPRGLKNGQHTKPERRAKGERNGSKTKPERVRRGSENGQAKLTEETVREARELYATGEWTYAQLGVRYGVVKSIIHRAVTGISWSHVK